MRQPFRVVALHVGENGDFLYLQGLERELRHDRSLERIDEADPEDVIAFLGHRLVGRAGRNHRDLVFLANRGRFERAGACDLAEDGNGFVAGDQFLHRRGRLSRFRLIVLEDDLDFASAEQPSGGVDLLHRQLRAIAGIDAEGRLAPGHGGELADDDVLCLRGNGEAEKSAQKW